MIYEPEAISYDVVSASPLSEFRRKIRTVRAGLRVFWRMIELVNPIKRPFVSLVLVSRKLLRWLGPYFMLAAFVVNIAIFKLNWEYQTLLFMQGIFYICSLPGYFYEKKGKRNPLFTIPFNFCLINLAAIIGFWRFISGINSEIWTPER